MIAIAIRFPLGRFHATPWGRHVKEGAEEWPPSPWRLLRTFVAIWKRKLDGDLMCMPDVVERLLRTLTTPPLFFLPPASTCHTKHYMPWFKSWDPKKPWKSKTFVFDTFVVLDKTSDVIVMWPEVTLPKEERKALEKIVECAGFFGRAESWVDIRVLNDDETETVQSRMNCFPVNGQPADIVMESVRILCADTEKAFGNEYTPKYNIIEGRSKNKREISKPIYNPDWHLCMETLELHDKRWSDPPGSKWVTYFRRKDCFNVMRKKPIQLKSRPRPTIARFALDGVVLPLVQDTLLIGETARKALMGRYGHLEWKRTHGIEPCPTNHSLRPCSEVFSGKDIEGKPLSGHQHAFYLPTDEDGDGRIDHLTVIAKSGFGPSEVNALDKLRYIKFGEANELNVVLLAIGQQEAISTENLFGPSCTWISATPFIATRYQKSNGRKKDVPDLLGTGNKHAFARHVLVEEIKRLRERQPDIPVPISVEPLNNEHRCSARQLRPFEFRCFRQKRGDDGGWRAAGAFKIIFPEPVRGPITLGHSNHFGLGLFVPLDEKKNSPQ